ncbi:MULTISPECIES: hypothetical protein [unclassified Streptomyces]|uniref:hypothetical protein n=1 Tax=unclassified Streptomyces TaxID=2593676 RepID=UPI001F1B2844|nr:MULTISPECIES: hypothetical protein [unclassified Streptomyces]
MTRPLREQLANDAAFLRSAGRPDGAHAIESVLAPRGWVQLRDTDVSVSVARKPLSLTMSSELKTALRNGSAAFAISLDALADEACKAVLEQGWLPAPSKRRAPGTAAGERTSLPVSVASKPLEAVRARLPELTARAGYRVTVTQILISWMADEMGVGLDQFRVERTMPFTVWTYSSLLGFWRETADARQTTIDAVVAEELRGLRDGSWVMERPSSPRHGASAGESYSRVVVRLERELGQWLVEAAPRLSGELNYSMTPTRLVTQVLRQRLGVPAGFPAG